MIDVDRLTNALIYLDIYKTKKYSFIPINYYYYYNILIYITMYNNNICTYYYIYTSIYLPS